MMQDRPVPELILTLLSDAGRRNVWAADHAHDQRFTDTGPTGWRTAMTFGGVGRSGCDRMATVSSAFEEGMLLRDKRRLKTAVAALERAVAEDPNDALAWFWLAATRDNRALEVEAIPAYERALDLGLPSAEETKAWTWLASSYSKTGRHTAAMGAAARAEELGGYEPMNEFEQVVSSVKRRSASKA